MIKTPAPVLLLLSAAFVLGPSTNAHATNIARCIFVHTTKPEPVNAYACTPLQ
jgi:hypothetical protein